MRFGVDRFAVMGASGGGPHAFACAALLPDRVIGAGLSGEPGASTDSFDWYAGMASPGALRAAAARARGARAFRGNGRVRPEQLHDGRLDGAGGHLGVARSGCRAGRQRRTRGLIDDDLAFAAPWGFDVATISVPVLLVQGGEDRVVPPSHADALLRAIPTSELWLRPRDGHVSVLDACAVGMDWLRDLAWNVRRKHEWPESSCNNSMTLAE